MLLKFCSTPLKYSHASLIVQPSLGIERKEDEVKPVNLSLKFGLQSNFALYKIHLYRAFLRS